MVGRTGRIAVIVLAATLQAAPLQVLRAQNPQNHEPPAHPSVTVVGSKAGIGNRSAWIGPADRGADAADASRRRLRGLDWFVFFVADVQAGFGPFVAVYLTTAKWTQFDIGLVMTVAGLISLVGQVPGGALVDAARSERVVAGAAVAAIGAAALAYAILPIFPVVLAAASLQAVASCVLGPAIAAISLGLVGHSAIGERFGRNARFASIGAGLSAGVMGAFGYFFSAQSFFLVTAALMVPALLVLRRLVPGEIDPERAHGSEPPVTRPPIDLRSLLRKRSL